MAVPIVSPMVGSREVDGFTALTLPGPDARIEGLGGGCIANT
jgi:hypothetical protein